MGYCTLLEALEIRFLGWAGRGRVGEADTIVWKPPDISRVQWTGMSESWKSPIVVSSMELEGPFAHLVQTPDLMETEDPERLRNLPKLTQAGRHRPVLIQAVLRSGVAV